MIVDDEADARARFARMLKKHPEIVVIGEARDGLDAVERIERLQPDLVFLDIEMPGLNGFEVLRSIPEKIALPLVIFVTGYDEHALSAFEVNALDYLLRPVEPDRLALAVEPRSQVDCAEQGARARANDPSAHGSRVSEDVAPDCVPQAGARHSPASRANPLVRNGGWHCQGTNRE